MDRSSGRGRPLQASHRAASPTSDPKPRDFNHIKTNIATAATAIISVVSQPNTRWVRVATNPPICLELDATIIMATMTGTTITPLMTALQNSALIGSSGERSTAMPSSDGRGDHA